MVSLCASHSNMRFGDIFERKGRNQNTHRTNKQIQENFKKCKEREKRQHDPTVIIFREIADVLIRSIVWEQNAVFKIKKRNSQDHCIIVLPGGGLEGLGLLL